jgi:LCP family protein required for cell wall assembly
MCLARSAIISYTEQNANGARGMDNRSAEDKLGFEERLTLLFLGGAGLLVWAVVMLLVVTRQAADRSPLLNPILPSMPTAGASPAESASFTESASLTESASPTTEQGYTSARSMGQLADPLPTSTPTTTATPLPTTTPVPTAMPSGVAMIPIDGEIEVIALLGLDQGRGAAIWRTDSIMLAFVDRRAGRLSLLSVPRDLWVRIPGYGSNRINTVDALGERTDVPGGGRALLDETLRLNLGVPVHHYVRVDFAGFQHVIDAMGGITIDVPVPLYEWFPDLNAPDGRRYFTVRAGAQQMDGYTALAYCRARMATGDLSRSLRQQQVLLAMWKKVLTLDTVKRVPELWQEAQDAVDTDLSPKDLLQLAYFASGLEPGEVHRAQLGEDVVYDWTTPEGAQVLLPRTEAIQQAILDLVSTETPTPAVLAGS